MPPRLVIAIDSPAASGKSTTAEARARRRLLQRGAAPSPADVAHEAALLAERDRRDSTRPVAPLRRAEDAVLLDTTGMSFEEQVSEIVSLVRARLPRLGEPDTL